MSVFAAKLLRSCGEWSLIEGFVRKWGPVNHDDLEDPDWPNRHEDREKGTANLTKMIQAVIPWITHDAVSIMVTTAQDEVRAADFDAAMWKTRPITLRAAAERFLDLKEQEPELDHHLFLLWLIEAGAVGQDYQDFAERLPLILEQVDLERRSSNFRPEKTPIARSNGRDFETSIAGTLRNAGFSVQMTPVTGDQGADIIARRDGITTVIQCKNFTGAVGNGAVQEVLGAKAYYNADRAAVITSSGFTTSATALAKAAGVVLIDRSNLTQVSSLL